MRFLIPHFSPIVLAAVAVTGLCTQSLADEQGLKFFEEKIRPVLVKHCYECHAATSENIQGGLRVDSASALRAGGESGAAINKEAAKSLLLRALQYDELQMPPAGKLSKEIIADFKKWLEMGAPDPRTDDAPPTSTNPSIDFEKAREFWSFRPLTLPSLPQLTDKTWARNDIDHFVLARLEEKNLQPVDQAERATLLRRVYFDLSGLPPTVQELNAFLADESPAAFQTVVDRLLASPQFGERWGRHWLDLARFSESNGGDRNVIFPHAWRYRNYVIDSLNADKPYDQFLREQIAGDLLLAETSEERDEQLVATGYLTLGPKLFMETKFERFKMDVVDEQLDVICRSVLGLTVSCARCHDHKFDPIPTDDYYALAGILKSTYLLYGTAAPAGNQYGHDRPLQPIGKDAELLQGPAEAWKKSVAEQISVRNKARSDRYRDVRQKTASENKLKMLVKGRSESEQEADEAIQKLKTEIAELEVKIKEWDEKVKQLDEALKQTEENPPSLPDYAMAVRDDEKPADTPVRIRGEYNKHGETVARGFLRVLNLTDHKPIPAETSGRLELAQWLTRPDNPLTARVHVNRVWQHLFGEGLVRSVNNFGLMGERPTHPELLDFLATRFQKQGWSTKSLIRQIVLSKTYRMSSTHHAAAFAVDPENRLLWRMNTRRLEVESLRDAILAASGTLDRSPPQGSVMSSIDGVELNATVKLAPEQLQSRHRTVYLPIARMSLPEVFDVFDFADPSLVIGKRVERTMASQQLYLMNSPFVVAEAERTAERILSHPAENEEQRIGFAYRLFLSRSATPTESKRASTYLQQARTDYLASLEEGAAPDQSISNKQAWTNFCQALFASAEFRYLD